MTAPPIRAATSEDVAALSRLDTVGGPERAAEIAGWVAAGHVRVYDDGSPRGYTAVTREFFGRPFLAMLMVAAGARGEGVGEALLREASSAGTFTSANLSNQPMQRLLARCGWEACGMVHGLDEGDPEVFYRFTGP
ncbi:hypothetical protein Afil01_13710 [Actinorhabdospora filicis]|uniref:N-acetyltransferase domain-containing protein n=1 Tax=Actinorhabdospora filicis TaxID=1785913 RepID=A0A9W6W7H4_9ACTN|nr:GNAT family N-acetyltransferase [Actinorhabdospora filicis]GLZ76564.1 hypothetical protein Afil01_13710 [Actinorhabdospora filicis]